MEKEVVIEIDQGGKGISVEVRGETGRQCLASTSFLEQVLGETVTRKLKPEYFIGKAKSRGKIVVRDRVD